jgi:mannose-6-phosphate isomerase-like protein (cupin superfamily)
VEQPNPTSVQNFAELIERRRRLGTSFLKFLDVGSLFCEVYSLAAGAVDLQQPHPEDEVYYVFQGNAKIRIGSHDYPVQTGDVIFVPAGETHYFFEIASDLELLVFFSKAPPTGK